MYSPINSHKRISKNFPRGTRIFLFIFLVQLFPISALAASFNDSASGDWNIGTTWGGGCSSSCTEGTDYPGENDTATIDSHTVTLTASRSTDDISIAGGTFDMDSYRLDVHGNWTKSSGTFTPGTGTVHMVGSGGTITSGGSAFNNLTVNDGLMGYWKLDETSGSTAADSSGYGNDGTHTNSPTISSTVASVNFSNDRSLDFDGSNDYVAINSSELTGGPVTISAWVNLDVTNTYQVAVSIDDDAGDDYFQLKFTDGAKASFSARESSGAGDKEAVGSTSLSTGTWYHVVGVQVSSTERYVYVNGIQDGSNTSSSDPQGMTQIEIGEEKRGGSHYNSLDGNIDDVRIYNRALSQYEISALAAGNQPATSSKTWTLEDTLDVNGDITLNAGTLDTKSSENNAISVAGGWENNGGVFTPNSSTVTFDGTTGSHEIQSGGQEFTNMTVSGNGGTWWLHDALEVDGTYTQSNGTLNVSTDNYSVIVEDFDQTAGTFTAQNGTLVLDSSSNQTITASSTLYNLELQDPTESGLVGYWKLDEGQGTTTSDLSGNSNNGTLTNGAKWSSTTPTTSFVNLGSMEFDGSNDYVDAGDSSVHTFGDGSDDDSFSVSFWMNNDSTEAAVLAKATGYGSGEWYITMTAGNIYCRLADESADAYIGQYTSISTNAWVHVTCTYDGSESSSGIKIYKDGSLGSLTASNFGSYTAMENTTKTFTIGRRETGSNYFDGHLDDVRIYNRVLSATEITNLANGSYADGDNATATYTLGAALDINNDLELISGILDVSGSNYSVNLAGDFANPAGVNSFTARSGTLTLDGTSQSFTGTGASFSAMTKVEGADDATDEVLTFAAGATYNISGAWTLTGRDTEDRINLVSSSSGSPWYVNPSGSRSISKVDVKDSYNLNATAVDVTDGVDSTGNTNWTFSAGGGGGGGEAPEFSWWALMMLGIMCAWVLHQRGLLDTYLR